MFCLKFDASCCKFQLKFGAQFYNFANKLKSYNKRGKFHALLIICLLFFTYTTSIKINGKVQMKTK